MPFPYFKKPPPSPLKGAKPNLPTSRRRDQDIIYRPFNYNASPRRVNAKKERTDRLCHYYYYLVGFLRKDREYKKE